MNLGRQIQVNSDLSKHRSLLIIVCAILLCSNLLLCISVVTKDTNTILLPMTLTKSFSVSGKEVSEEYLELISRDLIQSILNITPNNYEYNKEAILKLVHPSFYGALKQQLDTLSEDVKQRQISIYFLPAEMKVSNEELTSEITGYLETRIGLKEVGKLLKKYRMKFDYTGSQLTLKEFYEVSDEK